MLRLPEDSEKDGWCGHVESSGQRIGQLLLHVTMQ